LLEPAEFGTRPAIKVGCKFDAGGIEEWPSQMIEIHRPSIEGRTTLVNPQRMSRAGERRSGDQFRDRFSSEAHTRAAKQPVKRAPVLEKLRTAATARSTA
jgi:hypothetical protein